MTDEELRSLCVGDLVRHKHGSEAYIVLNNYGDRVTAIRIADLTNAMEWDVVSKVEKRSL